MVHTWVLLLATVAAATSTSRRSVLLITVDDLRPELGAAYNMPHVKTPHLDTFARSALTFTRAYCQLAVCSPSRNSFMTGRRPDTTRVWNFKGHFRIVGANWTTMPQTFKRHGYLTYAAGKLFHRFPAALNDDWPASWTEDEHNPFYWGNLPPIGDADDCRTGMRVPLSEPLDAQWSNVNCSRYKNGSRYTNGSHYICVRSDEEAALNDSDNKTAPQAEQRVEYDHRVATRTLENLRAAHSRAKNFFVAAGFRKPHADWRVPRRFWELYEGVDIPLAKHQTIGQNITELEFERNDDLVWPWLEKSTGRMYVAPAGGGTGLPGDLQRTLRRGYYAAVSFLDYEVGRVLAGLDALNLTKSTVTILHSDHGLKLGEHGDWSKCTNWEIDARVPLLIRAPWLRASIGARTDAIAELVDLYPTAVALAGLPAVPATEGLEGVSLEPVLRDPSQRVKTAGFSQYPRCPQYNWKTDPGDWECLIVPQENITLMGFSIRTEDARYTEWRVWKLCSGVVRISCADWTERGLVAAELYDHTGDDGLGATSFDEYEYENLAYDTSRGAQKDKLADALRAQFDRAPTKQLLQPGVAALRKRPADFGD